MTEKEIQQEYERICKKIGHKPTKVMIKPTPDITEDDNHHIETFLDYITHEEAMFLYKNGFLD